MNHRPAVTEAAYVWYRVVTLVDGDVAVTRRLLHRFVEDIPASWTSVEMAIASRDRDALAKAVHDLKGSFALVGADFLTDRMKRWEGDAMRGVASPAIDDLMEAREALAALLTGISGLLARMPSDESTSA